MSYKDIIKDLPSVADLQNKGIGLSAVIIATGHSYQNIDYANIPDKYIRFEINKMRVNTRIDYSMYYDLQWKTYFNEIKIPDNRKLISFKVHASEKTDYWYDPHIIPFSDSGFHALYLASEIMHFDNIYLVGYDYYKVDGKWHPYTDDFMTEDLDKKKDICLSGNINRYSGYEDKQLGWINQEWNSYIYNCNERSALRVFPFVNIF